MPHFANIKMEITMKKLLLVFMLSGLAVPAHAADMAQKFGAGVRGGNFNLRYFLSN